MTERFKNPVPQFHDSNGEILIEGFLLFEESGTNDLKDVWIDAGKVTKSANPVKLDGAGRCPNVWMEGKYKVTAYNNVAGSPGTQQWSRDPVGGEAGALVGIWQSSATYDLNDLVKASDDEYYVSITNVNESNDPTITPTQWSKVDFIRTWNTNETYTAFDHVEGTDGGIYYSVTSSNLGNDPVSDDGTNWKNTADAAIGDTVQGQSPNLQTISDASIVYVDKSQWPTIANNSTDADHDIDFSAGSIPDSTGLKLLTLGSTMVKQIDAAWAAGTNAGGLFSGTVAADTAYHMFLIRKDSDGSIDAGFDTSPVAANIPAGYTAYRRIHSWYTDGSANWVGFNQFGDMLEHVDYISDLSTTTPSTTGAALTLSVPDGLSNCFAVILEILDNASLARAWVRSTAMNNTAPDTTHQDVVTASAVTEPASVEKTVPVDSNGQVRYRASTGTVSSYLITTKAWIDPRID